ncbi:MAG: phosphate acetyltransferase [Flavobacteriales bacterium]|nr:phosphate acetyltransferase [Flavobacteriales bacterium]
MSNKGIYIATGERDSGKSMITLGLMSMLLSKAARVGYFRPIVEDNPNQTYDNHVDAVITHFGLDIPLEKAFVYTKSQFIKKKSQGQLEEVIDTIIGRYKEMEEQYDFILVDGTSFVGGGEVVELEINVLVAKNLKIPTLIVGSGLDRSVEEVIDSMTIAYNLFKAKDVEVVSLIANKVNPEYVYQLKDKLREITPINMLCYAIPSIETIANPTMHEIVNALKAKVLFGADNLDNQTGSYSVGAMQLRNYLLHLKDNALVITPGDRADILLGALQADQSTNYPKISGIVLTGNILPEDSILKLVEGLNPKVPVIAVSSGTYQTTNKIGRIKSRIYATNSSKIQKSIETFNKFINIEKLSQRLITFEADGITPKMFQYNLIKRAKSQRKRIVLPEGTDDRIIIAASRLVVLDVVDLTILGEKRAIEEKINTLGIFFDYSKIKIINPIESVWFEDYVETYYKLRKHKKITKEFAHDVMQDVAYFGTMMVYKGHADGMVSGAAHTTQHTIRPALQFIKTKPGMHLVSSVFFMCLEDRVSIFGDCAINPSPSAEELAEIAIASADSSVAFGIEPKVAMLSYSSGNSGQGSEVEKVREATEIVKNKRPDLKIEGPIQYDAAVDRKVGLSKMPESEVAGQASVLIFPDLNTGNNTYKAVQRETGALAIGPMLQGLNKPVNDLSRGCTVDDILNTVIITAIQAQEK